MKKILGLDLGTSSIGWALINEAENQSEKSEIIKLGVRVIQYDTFSKVDKSGKVTESKSPIDDFASGKGLSPNAKRTQQRGARRNLQRFKLRRKNLIKILLDNQIIDKSTSLAEEGKNSTHTTLKVRSKAAKEQVELTDFARILLSINKKRGYKSSRKSVNEEEGIAVDGMAVAKELYEQNLTPGQYVLQQIEKNVKYIPEFYRSDLQQEFKRVWETQKQFYPNIIDDELYQNLLGKNKSQTWAICQKPFGIVGIKLEGKSKEQKLKKYQLRTEALDTKISLEELAIVLQEINNDINKSSGYLGAISDRSKELYFNKITVGQYQYTQILENPNISLKNQVFYRQDYLDEFEQIWEVQSKYYPLLTISLKEELRDVVIFYQRKLKSQKHLISECQFEKHHKAVPKSSPLFQEFKIWQGLNNLELVDKTGGKVHKLDEDAKQLVFEELNLRGNLKANEIIKLLGKKPKDWKCNYEELEGNTTNQALFNIFQLILENEGYGFDWVKKSAFDIREELKSIFPQIGINQEILQFDANISGNDFDKQLSYQLWHLLYSAEDDINLKEENKTIYGNSSVALRKKLHKKFGFQPEYAKWLSNIRLQNDYGSLSSRAIKKIMPFLQQDNNYYEACSLAGYNHSNSLTKAEKDAKIYADKLVLLPKNSLRNPVVEKILNQMVNLVNQVIDNYGKPDEVRVELARELKKSAKERKEVTAFITKRTKENEQIKKLIVSEFGIPNPTKNDVVKYRLYEELKSLGYKTVFTNTYIPKEKLFSKEIDIEHIIPKALLFDDSFSNKTLAYREVNLKKRDRTALDFITSDYNADIENYKNRVESLHDKGNGISKGKYNKLLLSQSILPDGFIERDLRNSQYIAKKAKEMLFEVVRNVVPTTGSITDKLREDWDLINVMKELNLPKYKALGLTEIQERKDNKKIEVIKDWTKRNDHRHHAMDALTVAFTSHNHIQYLNNLNARRNEKHKKHSNIIAIEKIIRDKDKDGRKKFVAPIANFRSVAKEHIESIIVSFKAKNKVVTKNINKTKLKGKDNYNSKVQVTPRGQLHKETVYGSSKQPMSKPVKLNKRVTPKAINNIINIEIRELVLNHLAQFKNEINIAFDTKTLKNHPLTYKGKPITEVYCYETIYSIRKEINPDNFKNHKAIEKVLDLKIKEILKNRLQEYSDNPKEAFSNLELNPIWLNQEKGISVKRVAISGVSNVDGLHEKRDHNGNLILDALGNTLQNSFVSTGNNHHVAIYIDEMGKLQEKVVSFYEAVQRVNLKLPIIDQTFKKHMGWEFLFTMKQNELFVFPSKDFNPHEIDLLDERNASIISKHLFRVQKIASKNYFFRHHLETTVNTEKALNGIAYKSQLGLNAITDIIKVRTNHLGQIVQVGEY